jgi:hypothetical protein
MRSCKGKAPPPGRLQRAIERRDLLGAEAVVRELEHVSLADAGFLF